MPYCRLKVADMSSDYTDQYPFGHGYQRPDPGSSWTGGNAEYDGGPNDNDDVGPDTATGGWANAAGLNHRLWPEDKFFLFVCFLNGHSSDKDKVKSLIEEHYNTLRMRIRFVFLEDDDPRASDIRVSFISHGVSSSCIGNDAELHPDESTMTLNMHHDDQRSAEDRRKHRQSDVLHEFGHALGMEHEHAHPDCPIKWNYRIVQGRRGWDAQKVAHNYRKLDKASTAIRNAYDPKSIMHYPVERGDAQGGIVIPMNTELSDGDKEFLIWIYPMPEPRSSSLRQSRKSSSSKRSSRKHHKGRRGDEQSQEAMYRQEDPSITESIGVNPRVYEHAYYQPYEYSAADAGGYTHDDPGTRGSDDQPLAAAGYDYQLYNGEAGPSQWQGPYAQ
ncbi:Peptidase M12A domain-containing protein [Fusarium sp. Ph1]|nr:Peptidase M12A domain-containing protein [Fusarium sp. Ph1]